MHSVILSSGKVEPQPERIDISDGERRYFLQNNTSPSQADRMELRR